LILVAPLGLILVFWDRGEPRAATEIFTGIAYGCDRLATTDEGSGLLY
jgi:hypothetical protein